MVACISAYSYIGFISNKEVAASPDCETPNTEIIPDALRSLLDKYWNDGEFIGGDCPPEEGVPNKNSYKSITHKVIRDDIPNQRTEKIILKSDIGSQAWTEEFNRTNSVSPDELPIPPLASEVGKGTT